MYLDQNEVRLFFGTIRNKKEGNALLMRGLCRILQKEPDRESWRIERESRGKPFFPNHPELFFSVSDTGTQYACAFAGQQIGIDLQTPNTKTTDQLLKISRRFCHPDEYQYISKDGESSVRERFFQIWTAKEACVKYTGQGIDRAFSSICVLPGTGLEAPARQLSWMACGIRFCEIWLQNGCCLCVCTGQSTGQSTGQIPQITVEELTDI